MTAHLPQSESGRDKRVFSRIQTNLQTHVRYTSINIHQYLSLSIHLFIIYTLQRTWPGAKVDATSAYSPPSKQTSKLTCDINVVYK